MCVQATGHLCVAPYSETYYILLLVMQSYFPWLDFLLPHFSSSQQIRAKNSQSCFIILKYFKKKSYFYEIKLQFHLQNIFATQIRMQQLLPSICDHTRGHLSLWTNPSIFFLFVCWVCPQVKPGDSQGCQHP